MSKFCLYMQEMIILKQSETVLNEATELEESQSVQQVLLEHGKVNDTSRLQKTIKYCRRVRKYQEGKLNNITKQFRVLVWGLKESRVWKSR